MSETIWTLVCVFIICSGLGIVDDFTDAVVKIIVALRATKPDKEDER